MLCLTHKIPDRLKSTGYRTTTAGEEVLAAAESMENDIATLERRVLGRDQRLSGNIRITTADFLATHLLMPHIAVFSDRYPDIHLEIVTTYAPLDLDKREADVALRFTRRPPEHLVGRKVATLFQAPYASPDYLEKHDLGAGSSACWIGFDGKAPFPRWVTESALPHLPSRGQFESLLLQLEAAKSGMGIAMLPCLLGDAAAGVRRVPGMTPKPAFDLWLLTHRDVRTTARLSIFTQFLAQCIAAERARLEGVAPA